MYTCKSKENPRPSPKFVWLAAVIPLRVLVILTVTASGLYASKPEPCAVACKQFQALVDSSRGDVGKEMQALAFLCLIAEERGDELTDEMAHFAGFHGPTVRAGRYRDPLIRIGAYRHIGYMGTAAAVEYLQQVTPSAFKVENFERQELWPEVQIALRDARRRTQPNEADAVRYLEGVLEEEGDWLSGGRLLSWAMHELCNMGALGSLPAITEALRTKHRSNVEQLTQFCQQKMVVVASHPDRVQALSSALTINNAQQNPELVRWAISEIYAARQAAGPGIVKAYLEQLEAIPENTALGAEVRKNLLRHYRGTLRMRPPEK
jgi:hypothetical protein